MVYVDREQRCKRTARWHSEWVSHLTADSEAELDEFAAKIGIPKEWKQVSRRGVAHYDLFTSMRIRAMRNGAIERR